MTSRTCSRCHATLHREDEGTLVFCWNCGAPQVFLSEDLREQMDKQIADQHADPSTLDPAPPPPHTNAVIWRGALQCAALAGAVAAVFGLCAFIVPPVAVLSLFWILGAPGFILIIYSGRFRQTRITAAFGARLGLLCGLSIMFATMLLNTVSLLVLRFGFHSAGPIDNRLAESFAQMQAAFVAQSGPAAASMVAMLSIPEFRAGLVLSGAGLFLCFYLAFSATTGAFAGYLRSRSAR